jgi:hypothetical protein
MIEPIMNPRAARFYCGCIEEFTMPFNTRKDQSPAVRPSFSIIQTNEDLKRFIGVIETGINIKISTTSKGTYRIDLFIQKITSPDTSYINSLEEVSGFWLYALEFARGNA